MVVRDNEEGGADFNEHDTDEVVVLPELTEEAEDRILAKIQQAMGEFEDVEESNG